jgi:hypothetical protein
MNRNTHLQEPEIDPVHYAAEVCEITFNEENFFVNVTSGRRSRIYVLTPKHAKRLYLLLKKDIEKYEKEYGALKTELPKKKKSSTADTKRNHPFGFSYS